MIPKTHRFHGYGSLRYVYRHGKTVRGPLMALKFVANTKRSSYRLAVVVSKKVHKSAVVRNRMRRRLYEAVRRQADRIGAYDMVITVFRDQVATIDAGELDRQVVALIREAGVLSGKKSH